MYAVEARNVHNGNYYYLSGLTKQEAQERVPELTQRFNKVRFFDIMEKYAAQDAGTWEEL